MIYIEKLIVDHSYSPEEFLQQIPEDLYDRSWPLIVCGFHYREDVYMDALRDYFAGRPRIKPSAAFVSSIESLERVSAKALKMQGMVQLVSAACTSSAYAVYNAYCLSAMTGTPVVVTGASRLLPDAYGWYWFNSVRAIDGATGIPFDRDSKGFKPGEAQFFAVISAKPVDPIAVIEDMRFFSITSQFTDTGSIEQIQNQLFNRFDTSEVCWWNAHSPGTPMGDRAEHTIFNNIMGDRNVPISSLKGKIGHTLVASFLVETGIGIQSLRDGYIPPNTGLRNPIADDARIITEPVRTSGKTFLKFNMGFGGKNVLSRIKVLKD